MAERGSEAIGRARTERPSCGTWCLAWLIGTLSGPVSMAALFMLVAIVRSDKWDDPARLWAFVAKFPGLVFLMFVFGWHLSAFIAAVWVALSAGLVAVRKRHDTTATVVIGALVALAVMYVRESARSSREPFEFWLVVASTATLSAYLGIFVASRIHHRFLRKDGSP